MKEIGVWEHDNEQPDEELHAGHVHLPLPLVDSARLLNPRSNMMGD